ncbi:beta strand repeat-containing protein [Aquimarina spinulae]|uniref:beta strand repeat-containing protein n=1 Tax=Aquimarina spinulae TaxID=1192023 RepID=UPI000D552BE6|nr:Calx-beta domain-containing protein [Aquimarina spinulae]
MKKHLHIRFIIIFCTLVFGNFISYSQALIEIEVNWVAWSSENRVTFRDPSNTTIAPTICNPGDCFTGFSNTAYNNIGTPQAYASVPYGNGYTLLLEDTFGDGWNGFGSYVRVYQDGVLILESFPNFFTNTTLTFNVVQPPAELSITDIFVNENAGTATFQVTQIGATTGPFSVDYTTTDNTAIAGLDYTTTSSTLNFSGTTGEIINVVVPIIDNSYAEANETFNLILSNPSDPTVILDNAIATIIDDPGDTPIQVNAPLTLFDEFNGYYDYAVTGDSFRNSTVNECSIIGATTGTTLTTAIPVGATIEKAYLFWAHSSASPDESVTFEGQTVNADIIRSSTFGGASLYGMTSDVTTLIQGIPNLSANTFDFSNLTIDNGEPYCSSTVVLGGWSLMVFYTAPSLPAVSINLYNGFDGQQNNSNSYNLTGFFAIGATGSKTTILSWEGDQGLANNESLTVTTGSGTFTLSGDGGQTGGNPFNSTVYDNTVGPVVNRTTLGLDLDTYDISAFIGPGESTVTTNVGVGQDFVISNAVLLKVPSNLIIGTVFEDVNYGGGNGRDQATSSGAPIVGATVELYNNTGTFVESTTTDTNGQYSIGGMQNGTYSLRVVNSTVRSTRGGGAACTTCYPIQTYRRNYAASVFTDVTTEIGGAAPSQQDVAAGTLAGAQSISSITILSEGVVGMDFGFNFNTVVNTNESGQGSLEQFIVNSNNLDETGLDIEANSLFNPAAGEDTSVFMIPPTGDALGRAADINFANGYFDITISNGSNLTTITDTNTNIDGRTQTAYSNTNTGTIGSGGSTVGVSGNTLPNYDLPEIQVHRNNGDVLRVQGNNTVIRGLSIYAGSNSGIILESGSSTVDGNLIGVNADGLSSGNIDYGIEITGGTSTISNNYIASNTDTGLFVNGGTSTTIQYNDIEANGTNGCADGIALVSGSGVTIQYNLINNTAAIGIEGWNYPGGVLINENTITNSGQNGGICSGVTENSGVRLYGNNSSITSNIIANNGGAGVVITGGNTSGNLISQNSIYNNGTSSPALGIDIDQATTGNPVGDGVTINDTNDSDTGPNGSLNFPIFESIVITGNRLRVSGWSRPGATLEFFVTDISQGTASTGDNQLGLTQDYGEGQVYLGSAVEGSGSDQASGTSSYSDTDGNADTTNRFSFEITLASPYPAGTLITATATLSNSTSEFSNTFPIGAKTVITNRRITYRVKPN